MEILGRLEVPSVDLGITAEKTASNIGRKAHSLTAPCEQRIVTPIKNKTGEDLALYERTFLRLDRRGCG